jgi:hypothetical protein
MQKMNAETEKYMQKVLEKTKQEINERFGAKIDLNVKQQAMASDRMYKASDDSVAPAKSFHAAKALMFWEFGDIYTILNNLFQMLLDVELKNTKELGQLGESIEEIRNTLGMDVSKVKADLVSIRTAVNSDEIAKVAKFAEDFNKHVEESRKALEEYKKKMKENDLAT